MWRYLYAEQVIGNAFIRLVEIDKRDLPFQTLFALEKVLDANLRQKNNTMVSMSLQSVYDTSFKYRNLFDLHEEKISLKSDIEKSSMLFDMLDDYFHAGLPYDISQTVSEVFNAEIM